MEQRTCSRMLSTEVAPSLWRNVSSISLRRLSSSCSVASWFCALSWSRSRRSCTSARGMRLCVCQPTCVSVCVSKCKSPTALRLRTCMQLHEVSQLHAVVWLVTLYSSSVRRRCSSPSCCLSASRCSVCTARVKRNTRAARHRLPSSRRSSSKPKSGVACGACVQVSSCAHFCAQSLL